MNDDFKATKHARAHQTQPRPALSGRAGKVTIAALLTCLITFAGNLLAADDALRVGVLKFGTVNWELKTMISKELDKANGVAVEIVPFAGKDATVIALQGGEVDIIVTDWLWVSRQRSDGKPVAFAPYSSSVGRLMVPGDSDLKSLEDLVDRKIGIAGGPLDKGWLLLQGMAKQQYDLDLADRNEVVFGAPPLLAEKARSGELDAVLNFWHYCARLEADGFRELASVEEAAGALGSTGPVSAIGYVFDEDWANKNPESVRGFLAASRATKQLLNDSDEAWQEMQATGVIKDQGEALIALRDNFRSGIPSRALGEEIEDAGHLYSLLSKLGGEKLVGSAQTMADGTYWSGLASH